jgi:hypothetical protein
MTLVLVAVTMMVTAMMVMVMVVKKPYQATVASHQHRSLPLGTASVTSRLVLLTGLAPSWQSTTPWLRLLTPSGSMIPRKKEAPN